MPTLLKNTLVVDPASPHHGKRRDILIDKGRIADIAAQISEEKFKVVREPGLCISPGFTDLRAQFGDPGFEFKEDMLSGTKAAHKGGFTRVVLMPSTRPAADSKAVIEYQLNRTSSSPVQVLPTGCLSKGGQGEVLAEMFDMHRAGAVAFGDDKNNVSTELMVRALQYVQPFNGLIYSFPFDRGVNPGGLVHEGPVSAAMGIKGLSALSEELRLQRDIELLRYCGGRMHVSLISAAGSVALVRKAKKDGLRISSAVAAHQLLFTDAEVSRYDAHYKVLPPLRSETDRRALIAGLIDGTIDAICSDHSPEDPEHKNIEFDHAAFGISSIEAAFCTALTALEERLPLELIVYKLTTGPASVLGITQGCIDVGLADDFTVFSTQLKTVFTESSWSSRSNNTPLMGRELSGRIISPVR